MLIAISGGIGAGKSVVSEVLRVMGYAVFDCDAEARDIMDSDPDLHAMLCRDIHPKAVASGRVDRALISQVVFGDSSKLAALNALVHGAVFRRLALWRQHHPGVAFVECAILHTSGLARMVDAEWRVTAPADVRVERVKRRSGLSDEQILARIQAQAAEEGADSLHVRIIDNSPDAAILPQIESLIIDSYS